ncbi:MAG: hypothetical protein AB1644_04495 [Candidatus Zixiibacteriota bacterium]
MNNIETNAPSLFKQLVHLRRGAPALWYATLILVAAELIVSLVGPLIVPKHVYLSAYLGDRARMTTIRFLDDRDDYLVYDSLLGWRNRPNASRDKWQLDANGARSMHEYGLDRTTPIRALFLGSSLTNGGAAVTTDETISAYLEDSTTECLNFATMLYTLDQMYLAYSNRLWQYNANVIAVGLPYHPSDGLDNRYLPLRYPQEVYMPHFKPRLIMRDTALTLMPVPHRDIWRTVFQHNDLLDSLVASDEYYAEFTGYQRCGFSPLASLGWWTYKKARGLFGILSDERETSPLVLTLMRRLKDEAARHDAKVIYMLIPDQATAFPSRWRKRLPDQFGTLVANLRKEGFTMVDVRQVLRDSGEPPWQLFFEDGGHFRPLGNRLIADALRPLSVQSQVQSTSDLLLREKP